MVRRELVSKRARNSVHTKGTLCRSSEHLAGSGVIMCSQIRLPFRAVSSSRLVNYSVDLRK